MRILRSGYTLIEILIATLLMATLMSAIYGLFGLYASFLEAGRSQVQRQQLVRSVTQLLESDLRQLSDLSSGADDAPSAPTVSGFDGGLSEDAAEPQNLAADFDPLTTADETGVARLPVLGLSGTADSIRLVLHAPWRPLPDLPVPAAPEASASLASAFDLSQVSASTLEGAGQAPAVHELQQVAYHFEPPGFVGGSNLPLESGLYRVSASWLGFEQLQTASTGLSPDAFRQQSVRSVIGVSGLPEFEQLVDLIHVPEVVRCRFSYFDGSSWQTGWSSRQPGLPRIVKLEFEVVSAADVTELKRLLGDAEVEAVDVAQPIASAGDVDQLDPIQQIQRTRFEHLILLRPLSGSPTEGNFTGSTPASEGGEP